MSRFRKQLLFLCDALLFAVAVAGYKFITVLLPYTEVGAKGSFPKNVLLLYGCTVIAQLLFKTYDSLWRYAESREYLVLMCAAVCGFGAYEIFSRALLHETISFVLLAAIASLWVLEMLAVRFGYRMYRTFSIQRDQPGAVPVAIIGAGSAGVQLLNEIQHNPNSRYHVQCFFDDDPAKVNKRIRGVPISGFISQALPRMRAMDIHEAIFAIPSMDELHRKEILRQLADRSIRVSTLPSTLELIDQKPIRQQLREVRIEDLLGRDTIELDISAVEGLLSGRTVLVTGGGGSIGSELCRQVMRFKPGKLLIFDIYENCAYELLMELQQKYGRDIPVTVLIGSIRDKKRLDEVFETYHPTVVFHAAAHKHVPLMEVSPAEAVKNNVLGTKNLLVSASEHDVERFVQLSTDKAVNPTSVMGCTKRICEMLIQTFAGNTDMKCVAVRFGNVLGSHGSVIPLFEAQIKKGGPVTLTDPNIERYFMTIPEAAQLVLQAGALAESGNIYVLDMGEPVKIMDLAKQLIRFYGYEPGVNMEIKIVGLRPGEKLYEELMMDEEQDKMRRTQHNKIFVASPRSIDLAEFYGQLQELAAAAEHNDEGVVQQLAKMIPTFTPTRQNLKL